GVRFIEERFERRAEAEAELREIAQEAGPDAELMHKVKTHPWYHTIELPGGIVTPGAYDHRPLMPSYGIPEDLTGQRVRDGGSFDGFFALEFEGRGADVPALDIGSTDDTDLPGPVVRYKEQIGLGGDPLRDGFFTAHE